MKHSGLLLATVATALLAVFAVKAAGWFDQPSAKQRTVTRAGISDAERWYRTGQEKHWRSYVLQSRF